MKLRSRIKRMFSDEALRSFAALCDTMRINSVQHKMLIIQQLLKQYNVYFSVLGGATNRLTVYIDGYTVKFALDNQGFVDNQIEYSISRELQPYVPKTYETNGYILVAECVKTMSLDDFKILKSDIERILSDLSKDYLLGDVGYTKKNFENWGIRDDGSIVILDYAYIHRGTEKLFTCEVCGEGILRYDSTYSYLKCSNTQACTATFNYIDRKRIQGDQVDLDMIEEIKSESIRLPKGHSEKEVSDYDGKFISGNKRITNSYDEYVKYITEVKNKMSAYYDEAKALELMVKRAATTDPNEIARLDKELDELYKESEECDTEVEEVEYEPDSYYEEDDESEDDGYDELMSDSDYGMSLEELAMMAKTGSVTQDIPDEPTEQERQLEELVRIASQNTSSTPCQDEVSDDIKDDVEIEVDKEEVLEETVESTPEPVNTDTPATTIDVTALQQAMSGGNSTSDDTRGVYLNGVKI